MSQRRHVAFDAAVLVSIFAVAIAVHFSIVGRVPPGSDPGNWLALARELMGEPVMSADVAYPPVIPAALSILLRVLSPLESLAVVGIASRMAVGLAIYIVLRPTGRATAAFGLALALFAGYQSEIFVFGGYPQLLGTAAAVLALNAAVRYLREPHRTALVAALVLSLLTALTHPFSTAVLAGSVFVSVLVLLALRQVVGGFRTLLVAAAAFIPAGLVFVLWILSPSLSGNPTINPQGFHYGQAAALLGSVVRESPWAWGILTVGALLAIGAGLYRGRIAVPVEAMAWIISGATVWILFLEHRSLAFAQIGIIIAVATLPALVAGEHWPRKVTVMIVAIIVALGGIAAIQGVQRFKETVAYYRVVEGVELWALRDLTAMSDPGDVILGSRGRNDHHLGWWIEGYAERPTFTAANPSYLAFPDEREQAEIALKVFRGDLDPQEFLRFAEAAGIEYVVVDKHGPDAAWLSTPVANSLTRAVDGPSLTILHVP